LDKVKVKAKLDELTTAVSFLTGSTDDVLHVGNLISELKQLVEQA